MTGLKIFKEILEIIFGLAIVIVGIMFELDVWIILAGIGLILWAVYEIHKELRDSKKTGEVADMAEEREKIKQSL